MAEPPADYVRLAPAAKTLDVHPNTLRRWANSGRIEALKWRNLTVFRQRDLDRLSDEINTPESMATA